MECSSSKEEAKKVFEDQLKRLDVEYVDFYLLHALDADKWRKVLEYDLIGMCEEFREEGKIRNIGDLVFMMNIRFLKKFSDIMIGIFVNYN